MAAHVYRRRSYNDPSEGSWSCTPDGVCRFNPNDNNHNYHQQQQGFVMKFETSFEHLQPSHNHGLVVKEPPKPKPKPVEEFLNKVQTEASQPQAPFFPNGQSPPQRFQIPISSAGQEFSTNVQTEASQHQPPFFPNSHPPPQRFQIPISSAGQEFSTKVQTEASQHQPPFFPNSHSLPQRFQIPISSGGHWDDTVFADSKPNKQDKERGPTHGHGHGHGGWDEPHQHHQFMERSWSNNDNDHKGDYFTKETRSPWTHDTRWLTRKSSSPDNRLSRPMNNIDEAMDVIKGFAIMPQLPDKEAKSKHSNADMKPPPQSNSSPMTISSSEAARKYKGQLVPRG